jgi:hypothetical protein
VIGGPTADPAADAVTDEAAAGDPDTGVAS